MDNNPKIKELELEIRKKLSEGLKVKIEGNTLKAERLFWEAYKMSIHLSNILSTEKQKIEEQAYHMWTTTLDLQN